jgi:predicted phosphodiesterase
MMHLQQPKRTLAWLLGFAAGLSVCLAILSPVCYGQAPENASVAAASADLLMGPYVDTVSTDGARVHWISPAGVKGDCRILGDSSGAKVEFKALPITGRPEIHHVAIATGLKPGQAYQYVVTSGKDRAEGTLRTALPAGSQEPFTFITYSDWHSSPSRHRAFSAGILREAAPAFLLITGDLNDDGDDWPRWKREFFDPSMDLFRRAAVWAVRGNHQGDGITYKDLFFLPGEGPHRSFDYGNLHVVCLDQYEDQSPQRLHSAGMARLAAWLEKDLAATKATWKLVCYHEPTFNVAGHGSEWGRREVLPILEKYGVDIVLSGHSHVHERFLPIGPKGAKPIIHIVGSSSGGGPRATEPSPILAASHSGTAYCLFTIRGNQLQMAAKDPNGVAFDELTLVKTGGVYQKEVMDAAVSTEEAVVLVKAFQELPGEFAVRPRGDQAVTIPIQAGRLPQGGRVKLTPDPNSQWTSKPVTFVEGNSPAALVATPPAGVLLAEGRGFSPPLLVRAELEYMGRTYASPLVPVRMSYEALHQLVPVPQPVSLPAAKNPFAIDGNLADWKDIPYVRLPSTKADSKDFKMTWRPDGLYGAVRVVQKDIRPDPEAPWDGDGLELYLESDARRRLVAGSEGTPWKFHLLPQADSSGGKLTVRRSYGKLAKEPVQGAWMKTPDGYTMGFHFVLHRGEQVTEQFSDTSAFRTVGSTPAYWGQIQLTDK